MSPAKDGAAGRHVSFSASGSRLPSAATITFTRAMPGLIGPRPELRFTGTAKPGVVHSPGLSPMIADCRTPLAARLAGFSRAPLTLVTPQAGSAPRHASSGKVHMPSALPSRSHAEPSTQVVAAAVIPPQVTMQSVAAGPPPPKQSEPGQAAA